MPNERVDSETSRAGMGEQRRTRFYEPPSRLQLVDKLLHLIRFSDFMLVVSGESGVGKSSLLREVVPQSDSLLKVIALRPSTELDSSTLITELSRRLPEPEASHNASTLLQRLKAQVTSLESSGQRLLLIMDDADFLTDSALEVLFEFLSSCHRDSATPQVLLVGLPAFSDRIGRLQLASKMDGRVHFLALEPFVDQEMREYLAIFHPDVLELPKRAVRKLIRQAKGSPGEMERLLTKKSGSGAVLPRPGVKAFPFPWPHMVGIGVVLFAVTLIAAFQFMPDVEFPADSTDRVAVPLPLSSERSNPDISARLAEQENKLASARQVDAVPLVGAERSTRAFSSSSSIQPVQIESVRVSIPQVSVDEPKQVSKIDESRVNAPLSGGDQVVVDEVAVAAERLRIANQLLKNSEQKLLSWPSAGYTLQVLGARERTSVGELAAELPGDPNLLAFSTTLKGQPWHVLVYRYFPSRAEAVAAVVRLPSALRNQKPWPRPVAGIQAELKQRPNP